MNAHLPADDPAVHHLGLLHQHTAHQAHREHGHAGRGSNLVKQVQRVRVVIVRKVDHTIAVLGMLPTPN